MAKYKQHLEDNLFSLNTELRQPLLHVRQLCLTIEELPMYRVTRDTSRLNSYVIAQQKQRDKAPACRLRHPRSIP